jgi:hypothetical protein
VPRGLRGAVSSSALDVRARAFTDGDDRLDHGCPRDEG